MAKKNFQTAPKPSNSVSLENIQAFERGGAGNDQNTQTHKPANVGKGEPTKRLSVDLPLNTHLRFKSACSATNRKMVKEVEAFIVMKTAELEKEAGITHN